MDHPAFANQSNARGPLALGAIAAAAVMVGGCGSSKNSATTPTSASGPAAQSAPAGGGEGAAPAPVTLRTKASRLGTILAAGPKRLTVYLFEADTGSTATCTGPCAAVWPPVPAAGTIVARGGAEITKIARVARADGTKQLTYNGHPLYFYARDGDRGDAYGQALKSFGASWYVLRP